MSLQDRASALRHDLKQWEKLFAASHSGRKPGRNDIKGNAHIAAKYKEYDRLRALPCGKRPSSPPPQAAKRQKVDETFVHPSLTTPKHHSRPIVTPSKSPNWRPDENDVVVKSPSVTPRQVHPTCVGPTPQKDGIPLGLFDLLSPREVPHPIQKDINRPALSSLSTNVPTTPSKRSQSVVNDEEAPDSISHPRFMRTPTSAGKRFLLDTIVTPLKDARHPENRTPSSSTKHLHTPAFLRRDTARLSTLSEENEPSHEQKESRVREPFFKKRKGFGRSLSAIIRGLRKRDDDEFEDEMEIQREMEMEMLASYNSVQTDEKAYSERNSRKDEPQVLVEDSQIVMPLGPDGQGESEGEDSNKSELGAGEQPRRPWKKRGMKRQTKRVNIRPVAAKPKTQAESFPLDDDEDIVAESQNAAYPRSSNKYPDLDSDFVVDDVDEAPSKGKAMQSPSRNKPSKSAASQEDRRSAESILQKKSKPKVNPQAHANYRRLKIKSKNGKGQGRRGFGRARK